jgi:hypothetical protein
MKYAILGVKLVIWSYLAYLLWFLAAEYEPAIPGFRPPFGIFVIDTINLFIHEAGHFFFKIFGQWVYVLGGSLFQVLVPLALAIVTLRQAPPHSVYAFFWTGESMVNVSVYIKDASEQRLHLIARGLIHDWNWLLSGDPDSAEILGGIVFYTGLFVCFAAFSAAMYFAYVAFKEDMLPQFDE